MQPVPQDLLKEYVQSQHFTSTTEIMAAMKEMFRDVIQTVMEVEMDEELGRERCERSDAPEGAFYMFINIKKYGMDSLTFCEKMLKEGLVGLIPGCYFDCEGYMRLSYCYSDEDLKEGLDRIEKFIKTL